MIDVYDKNQTPFSPPFQSWSQAWMSLIQVFSVGPSFKLIETPFPPPSPVSLVGCWWRHRSWGRVLVWCSWWRLGVLLWVAAGPVRQSPVTGTGQPGPHNLGGEEREWMRYEKGLLTSNEHRPKIHFGVGYGQTRTLGFFDLIQGYLNWVLGPPWMHI